MEKAAKEQGKAVFEKFEQLTPPYSNGKRVEYPVAAFFVFVMNDKPMHLNMVVRDRSACGCEAVTRLYCPCVSDGSFNDHSKEVIVTYFKDADVDEIVKMTKHLHK